MPHALKNDDQIVINHSLVMPFLRPQCWSWGGWHCMCWLLVIPFDFGHVSAMGCAQAQQSWNASAAEAPKYHELGL